MVMSRGRLLGTGIVVFLALVASACGGPATPGVASLTANSANTSHHSTSPTTGTPGTTTKQQAAVDFTKCMRAHGVKSFPEPKVSHTTGGGIQIGAGSGIDPNSPTFRAAQNACQSLLPKPSPAQLHQMEQHALAFAKCMRSHGVPNWPDPKFTNTGMSMSIGAKTGIDPNSPTFQHAQQTCAAKSHVRLPKGGPGTHGTGNAVIAP